VSRPLFSASWYRVAELRPRLRSHARIHRRRFRGRASFVLEDPATGQFHQLTPEAHFLVRALDGRRSVQEIWSAACETLGDATPTQDEVIRLLGQLHAADLLQADLPPDVSELLKRRHERRRRAWLGRLSNPFAVQVPLFDPERFLTRTLSLVRPLFGWAGAALWLTVVATGGVLAAVHWQALTSDVLDRLLAPRNVLLVWLTFPVLKALHELGHAFAVKRFGGEVHDLGVIFLVFSPVPYVDGSAASAFPRKRERILVGAAGMIVELFLAALALFVWVVAEPGLVRTLAYNAALIGGLSTVAFNANPLLRFDGYFILSDWIEIPNLRQRANRYVLWWVERHLFGSREAEVPDATPGERRWFVFYAVASFLYRTLVMVAIALLVLERFFYAGVLLVAAAAAGMLFLPLGRGVAFVARSPRLRRVRRRAVAVTTGAAAAVLALLLLPVPHRTRTEGVVWIPDEAIVRAGAAGFVERVVATPGASVREGDLLFELREPVLEAEVRRLEARRRELEARRTFERTRDPVAMQVAEEELGYVMRDLARAEERLAELDVRSRGAGTFVVPGAADLPGRFVRRGETLAHVVSLPGREVRAVVSQSDAGLVRERTRAAHVRLAERLSEPLEATLLRVVPAAAAELPSSALGGSGGGAVVTDPSDPRGRKAIEPVFEVELALPPGTPTVQVGGRVHVRFDHGLEPLAVQGWRRLRQLFLARLDV
jgi:putative peptide zinc metalloprotease protein